MSHPKLAIVRVFSSKLLGIYRIERKKLARHVSLETKSTILVKRPLECWAMYAYTISYRNSKFTSVFWKSLHKALGTKLNMSLAYHIEIDRQIEHVNKVLKDMLRMYCMEQKTKWEDYLYLVEFAYNNGYHSSLGMAPFEALYGRRYKTPLTWDNQEDQVMIQPKLLKQMEEQLKSIRWKLKEVADWQKSYTDLKRTSR